MDHLVHEELKDHQAYLDSKVRLEIMAKLDHLDLQV